MRIGSRLLLFPLALAAGCIMVPVAGTATPPVAGAAGQPLGCFKDQGDSRGTGGRDLDGFFEDVPSLTTARCVSDCAQRGFAYAATQYRTQCFCGNSYGRSGPATNCDERCAGAPDEICGGTWASSVYAIGGAGAAAVAARPPTPVVVAAPPPAPVYVAAPPPAPVYVAAPPPAPVYVAAPPRAPVVVAAPPPARFGVGHPVGCFRDQGAPQGTQGRDLAGFATNEPRMRVGVCVEECGRRGFAYAGMQFGTWCFCGNSYGRSGPANNCDTRCAGNPSEICGGSWANSVYATGR